MIRRFEKCPRCGCKLVASTAMNGLPSKNFLECTECNTYVNTYIPQEQQEAFHKNGSKFRGNFGGFGSGKTMTSQEEVYKHAFITPNGNTLIGAKHTYQYEQTIKRDIECDLPAKLVAAESAQQKYIDLINGHRIMYRPLDDEGKLRSLNLSMFVIVEASEVNSSIFAQLKNRLRNAAATVPEVDVDGNPIVMISKTGVPIPVIAHTWFSGVVESNPDSGWIREDVLLVSKEIFKFGDILDEYPVAETAKDKFTSSFVTATHMNAFLPPDFEESNAKNKPAWWIKRFLYGSFQYSEGLVYPSAMTNVIEAFDIPKHWKRLVAFDYGLSDNAAYLCVAIDQEKGICYAYKEAVVNDRNVEELALLYFQVTQDIPSGGLLCPPLIDPKSAPKRDYDKKSLGDHFLEYGIYFKPGYVSVDARVFRLNTYFESGKLKVFDTCEQLVEELKKYKFPDKQLGKTVSDKPQDKNNHVINPLEWITMELPADPGKILYGMYNNRGEKIEDSQKEISYEELVFGMGDPGYIEQGTAYEMTDYTSLM